MLGLLAALAMLGLFLWCYLALHNGARVNYIQTRDIACSQVCDINNPGALTICSQGRGIEAKEACKIYYSCVKGCRERQEDQIKENPLRDLPINPEESWGSRYSHLLV